MRLKDYEILFNHYSMEYYLWEWDPLVGISGILFKHECLDEVEFYLLQHLGIKGKWKVSRNNAGFITRLRRLK